jgi:drug/metabolite transporter (DMT)-like permease
MLMAFFILHESVAPLQWAGMALILIGIVLPNTQAVKEALCRK